MTMEVGEVNGASEPQSRGLGASQIRIGNCRRGDREVTTASRDEQ